MLFQIHWQLPDGSTQFLMQRDLDPEDRDGFYEFVDDVKEKFPQSEAPNGAFYMMCNERSNHFMKTSGVVAVGNI